jgi:hypothetical protein
VTQNLIFSFVFVPVYRKLGKFLHLEANTVFLPSYSWQLWARIRSKNAEFNRIYSNFTVYRVYELKITVFIKIGLIHLSLTDLTRNLEHHLSLSGNHSESSYLSLQIEGLEGLNLAKWFRIWLLCCVLLKFLFFRAIYQNDYNLFINNKINFFYLCRLMWMILNHQSSSNLCWNLRLC